MLYNIFMNSRQDLLLKAIVELHIDSANAVGSKTLVEEAKFDLSTATIRNEMSTLETDGFIYQPHTSSGRVPTIKGYQYYLDNLLSVQNLSEEEERELKKVYQNGVRDLAKYLVDKTQLASIIAFAPSDFYFTGLFNLFSQPEFEDYKMVLSMSQVVDSLEKALNGVYHQISEPKVLLGPNNPFSEYCSVAITPLETKDRELLAILGPVRMDYNKILALLASVVKITKV
jgi:transcriptional regulator of heat shock response